MNSKESAAAFNEMDANCNSCCLFKRLPHEREAGRFLRGQCDRAPATHPLFYRKTDSEFWIHPNDFMGMTCWEPRK